MRSPWYWHKLSDLLPLGQRTYPILSEQTPELRAPLKFPLWFSNTGDRTKDPPEGRGSEGAREIRGELSYFPAKVGVGLQGNQIPRWR